MRCAVALVLAGILALGCGQDDGAATDAAGAPSAASGAVPGLGPRSPRAAADRICAAAERRIASRVKRRFPDLNVADGVPLDRPEVVALEIVAPAYRRMLARLRTLNPPPEPVVRFRALLGLIAAGVDQLAADPELIAAPRTAAMRRAERLARKLGFRHCAI